MYGSRRIQAQLKREGIFISRDRVRRLMKELDIQGAMPAKKSKPITTTSDKDGKYPPDQVKRQFYASAPNQLWVSDITYVRTLVGWCYVALISIPHPLTPESSSVFAPSSKIPSIAFT